MTPVAMAIFALVEAYGVKDITPSRARMYDAALSKIPAVLLPAMVERCIATRRPWGNGWLPAVSDLLADAEAVRQEVVAANPYTGCAECAGSQGWREIAIDGRVYAQRCPCLKQHLDKLKGLGAGRGPLMLPPAASGDFERIGE